MSTFPHGKRYQLCAVKHKILDAQINIFKLHCFDFNLLIDEIDWRPINCFLKINETDKNDNTKLVA